MRLGIVLKAVQWKVAVVLLCMLLVPLILLLQLRSSDGNVAFFSLMLLECTVYLAYKANFLCLTELLILSWAYEAGCTVVMYNNPIIAYKLLAFMFPPSSVPFAPVAIQWVT